MREEYVHIYNKDNKRVKIGRNLIVGFHGGIIENVLNDVKVFGYPARIIERWKS